jgi:putative oxidoreductase
MKKLIAFLQLRFLPRSPDWALLALRLWLGITLALVHGWSKVAGYPQIARNFPDPLGIGSEPSLALVIFAEVFCAVAVGVGLFARLASLVLVIQFGVAFGVIHHALLQPGPESGELAFIYLAGFVGVLIAGPGRFSLDAVLGDRERF